MKEYIKNIFYAFWYNHKDEEMLDAINNLIYIMEKGLINTKYEFYYPVNILYSAIILNIYGINDENPKSQWISDEKTKDEIIEILNELKEDVESYMEDDE